MSRTIPATRRCVAPSSSRIDLEPSGRAAAGVLIWAGICSGVFLCAVELPLPARIVICACLATANLLSLQSVFLLRGPGAVRSIRWTGSGELFATMGQPPRELNVFLAPSSARLGRDWLLVWLVSCDGVHGVLIDATGQDSKAFRRLCRRLEEAS